MKNKLKIPAIGLAVLPCLDAIIGMIEAGAIVGFVKVPSIVIALILAWFLVRGRQWALVLSIVLLSITTVILGLATIYIGGTSDLYPTWKIATLSIMVIISVVSTIYLALSLRESDTKTKQA